MQGGYLYLYILYTILGAYHTPDRFRGPLMCAYYEKVV